MDQQHDQKQFLDLLQAYKSEDTKKARRNFSFVGFIVISAWILGIQLTEIKVFGVDLSRSSELYILVIAFLLLVYWASMFFLSYRRDSEIQKEREIHLNVVIEQIFNRWNAVERNLKENQEKGQGHKPSGYNEVKAAVQAYEQQKERTEKVRKYGNLIHALELYIPIIIGCIAAAVILVRIWYVL